MKQRNHLVQCPSCGKDVLDHMAQCPFCKGQLTPKGYVPPTEAQLRKRRIFKWTVNILALLLALYFFVLKK